MSGRLGLVCNNCGKPRKESELQMKKDKQGRPRYRICDTCRLKVEAWKKENNRK